MAPVSAAPWTKQLTWRIAALWLVVLAVALAVAGIVLAILQTRALTTRLMAPVEVLARDTADRILTRFEREIGAGMNAAAKHLYDQPDAPWVPPSTFPVWIDGIYVWDGAALIVLARPTNAPTQLAAHIEGRLRRDRQPDTIDAPESKVEILYDAIEDEPVVLAYKGSTGPQGTPVALVGYIDLSRLRSHLVEPLLPVNSGLELVPSDPDTRYTPWSQRLLSAMRYWEIRPTDEFVRDQQQTVWRQTLVHLGLSLFALATLLVAMWVLVRVVRREMALTEMKSNFVADVSHELKTPLALIHLFGETLQSGRVTSEEKRQEYYQIITRESTRLTNLINNILDFARLDAGRKRYTFEATDIAEVVRGTYEAYRAQLDHAGFEHHLTVSPHLPRVDADADAIAQALINLINNAIKYSGEDRHLAIDLSPDTRRGGPGVLISIHDRGIGIRPEDRAHLFDGFFRARDARVREQGGAGLGLALVKHIVDSHGGSLDVESRLIKGTTFHIFLPATDRRTPKDENSSGETTNRSPSEVE